MSQKIRAVKSSHRSVLLTDYAHQVEPTDRLPLEDLQPVLLGLFGEVGSIMATAKKFHREKEAYAGYRHAVEEEFGDTLWYLTALCRRLGLRMDEVFAEVLDRKEYGSSVATNDHLESPISNVATPISVPGLDTALLQLGETAAGLFKLRTSRDRVLPSLLTFVDSYLRALRAAQVSFAEVASKNIAKTRGRFLDPDYAALPTFDDTFPEEERIPSHFEITISQRGSGRSYLRWHGVFIGDPLTDNILDHDGYRFHDVFHFAHAAILHWSPTFRALIRHKRKSDPKVDEAQDGGRASVVEEGLTAWLFSRAKELNYFENQASVSFDLLKTIQQSIAGYEVEACPLRLWEIAIIQGYAAFRQVMTNQGGIVVGDRSKRTIEYLPLKGSER
jgi:NTP pyrophosphatase (non-canonical NTP hydrolase)